MELAKDSFFQVRDNDNSFWKLQKHKKMILDEYGAILRSLKAKNMKNLYFRYQELIPGG